MNKKEFKIICINDTKGITDWSMSISKLSVFHTDIYSYNYGGDGSVSGDYLRLLHDDKWIIGLYYKSDFMKLSDYRKKIVNQILELERDSNEQKGI